MGSLRPLSAPVHGEIERIRAVGEGEKGGFKMDKVTLSSNEVAKSFGIFSQGVKSGNLIFVSGQISKNAKGEVVGKGDIRAQTRQCIENLKHVLKAGGLL